MVHGLQLAPEKTLIAHIAQGFDFLGQNERKYGSKLRNKPAWKSVNAPLTKPREVSGKNKAAWQSEATMPLNRILRGWATYHRHMVSATTCSRIDHRVRTKLRVWAECRHARKNARWIKPRYFLRQGLRNWVFASARRPGGLAYYPTLFRFSGLPNKRHTKVRSEANPIGPAWHECFERRAHAHRIRCFETGSLTACCKACAVCWECQREPNTPRRGYSASH